LVCNKDLGDLWGQPWKSKKHHLCDRCTWDTFLSTALFTTPARSRNL
jgi:hypothetical protein